MTQRDRAWRRRVKRILLRREDHVKEMAPPQDLAAAPQPASAKLHRPGKLSPIQDLKQAWQLSQDAREGWVGDPPSPDQG